MTDSLQAAADLLRKAKHVAILTGAGISAESGIPTFRHALTGLWARFDAEDLATPQAFKRDKALVWGWYEWRRMQVMRTQPNPGHVALAALTQLVPETTVITQNVDDLHEKAGSTGVLHLHGSLFAPRCFACARPHALPDGVPDEPDGGRHLKPPTCTHCGGSIRPGIVWFGEKLPEDAWSKAEAAVQQCDLLITVGTSGLVFPAASLPILAHRLGKPVIQINPSANGHDEVAQIILRGTAGAMLPALLKKTWPDYQT